MIEEPTVVGLAKPPAIYLSKAECSVSESEEDSPLLLSKSKMSLTSTVDSPLLMGQRSPRRNEELEQDEVCSNFEQFGSCLEGSDCLFTHRCGKRIENSSFLLENYPELVTRKFGRRILSFL